MSLQSGTRLGPYEIGSLRAEGGMGEVYLARDTRLERTVAVKVIKSVLDARPDMRRRFHEEGQLAARLDHPNICRVYDVGHEAGVDFLVMEFVEGRPLSERLREGCIPLADLIRYAIEIASGLAYAHRRGVVHRDLKPGNILLTPNGAKIIDFGLGRLARSRPSEAFALLETRPVDALAREVISGTPRYLPPERLEGLEADHRGDIFAFGAVFYEMATGRAAFDGASPAAIVAAVLGQEPDPITASGRECDDIDWIIRRCLKKRPDERWDSMSDVEAILRRIASPPPEAAGRTWPATRPAISRWVALTGLVVLVLAAAAYRVVTYEAASQSGNRQSVALTIPPPRGGVFALTESSTQSPELALSPDGRYLAFVASTQRGVPEVWVRPLDSIDARPLPGTEDASYPFWSPTGRSIAFFAERQLKRVDLAGGPPRTLTEARTGRGGTWNRDDVILFSPGASQPIFRVDAEGAVRQQTTLATSRGETSHRWPQFLPDGRQFIYFAHSVDEIHSGIYLASLERPEQKLLVRSGFAGVYDYAGHLLYASDGALLAADLDLVNGRLSGIPIPVAEGVATSSNFYGAFSTSMTDVLAYARRPAALSRLIRMTEEGKQDGAAVAEGRYVDFRISPDHRFVAVAELDARSDKSDLHLLDTARGTDVRLTTSPATDASPVWSPDGTHLVFRSSREGAHDLYIRATSGSEDDRVFLKTAEPKYPTQWTDDGELVIFHTLSAITKYDVWAAPVAHPERARPLVRTEFEEMQGQVSPDRKWLAYTSNQSGHLEVYVQPMHGEARRWQISTHGGSDPKWSADGRRLFYVAVDRYLMSVRVSAGAELDPGTPRQLFQLKGVFTGRPYLSVYDLDSSRNRFLINEPLEDSQTAPLTIRLHWSDYLRNPR